MVWWVTIHLAAPSLLLSTACGYVEICASTLNYLFPEGEWEKREIKEGWEGGKRKKKERGNLSLNGNWYHQRGAVCCIPTPLLIRAGFSLSVYCGQCFSPWFLLTRKNLNLFTVRVSVKRSTDTIRAVTSSIHQLPIYWLFWEEVVLGLVSWGFSVENDIDSSLFCIFANS